MFSLMYMSDIYLVHSERDSFRVADSSELSYFVLRTTCYVFYYLYKKKVKQLLRFLKKELTIPQRFIVYIGGPTVQRH